MVPPSSPVLTRIPETFGEHWIRLVSILKSQDHYHGFRPTSPFLEGYSLSTELFNSKKEILDLIDDMEKYHHKGLKKHARKHNRL